MAGRLYLGFQGGANNGLGVYTHSGAVVAHVLTLLPGRDIDAVDVSRDGQFIAAAHRASGGDGRVTIFEFNGTTYTQRESIAMGSPTLAGAVCISDDGKFLVHLTSTIDWRVRMWNGSSYVQTATLGPTNSTDADFSGFRRFAIRSGLSANVYQITEATGAVALVSSVSFTGTQSGAIEFSKSGRYVAGATSGATVHLALKAAANWNSYAVDGGTFNQVTPVEAAIDNNDTYFVYGNGADLQIYKNNGAGTYTLQADPATEPGSNIRDLIFSEDTNYLFISETSSPFATFYSRAGDVFTKEGNISVPSGVTTIGGVGYGSAEDTALIDYALMTPSLGEFAVDIDAQFPNRMRAVLGNFDVNITADQITALSASAALIDSAVATRAVPGVVAESVVMDAPADAEALAHIIERLTLTVTDDVMASAFVSVVNSVHFGEVVQIVRDALITENVSFGAALTTDTQRIVAVMETLVATGVASSMLEAAALVSAAFTMSGSPVSLFAADVVDALVVDDTLVNQWVANTALIENAVIAAASTALRGVELAITEPLALTDLLQPNQVLTVELLEAMGFNAVVVVDGEAYVGWVVNTASLAPSEYRNFDFNSMARLGDRYYGVNDEGLFLLDGSDDAGDPIEASILTGQLDFGSSYLKRCEYAHVGYTASGELVMKVITTQDGARTERWYKAKTTVAGDDREGRFKLGKGVKSRYWQFEWVNVEGADFELDRVEFTGLIELDRRV